MNISKKVWDKILDVLKKYNIPYTTHYDGENKHIQINLVIIDFFDNKVRSCKGCCHDGCCGYFSELNKYDISNPEEEQKAFEEFCCGCCCGDGAKCNRDQGCNNYETELIMG